jgi:hypothetical protein
MNPRLAHASDDQQGKALQDAQDGKRVPEEKLDC